VSLGDRDRFQIRPHDSTLEQTADSQEKEAGDAVAGDPPKPSPVEPELVMVSSSGEPSGPKRHVSQKFYLHNSNVYPSVAPEGESKCLHLGLPSETEFFGDSSLFPLV
jgi:hypothetical protein